VPYFVCPKCEARFGGWGVGKYCDKCGSLLKEILEEEFDKTIKEKNKREKEEKE